jgi:hypothetical protein
MDPENTCLKPFGCLGLRVSSKKLYITALKKCSSVILIQDKFR